MSDNSCYACDSEREKGSKFCKDCNESTKTNDDSIDIFEEIGITPNGKKIQK